MAGAVGCSALTEPPAPLPTSSSETRAAPPASAAALPTPAPPTAPTPTIEETVTIGKLAPGKGPEVKNGVTVRVHYGGTFADSKKFSSSCARNKPFPFLLAHA